MSTMTDFVVCQLVFVSLSVEAMAAVLRRCLHTKTQSVWFLWFQLHCLHFDQPAPHLFLNEKDSRPIDFVCLFFTRYFSVKQRTSSKRGRQVSTQLVLLLGWAIWRKVYRQNQRDFTMLLMTLSLQGFHDSFIVYECEKSARIHAQRPFQRLQLDSIDHGYQCHQVLWSISLLSCSVYHHELPKGQSWNSWMQQSWLGHKTVSLW